MLELDWKYVTLVSSNLQGFTKKTENVYNFRCPICGDSKKHLQKKRAFFYVSKDETRFHCHNCGKALSLKEFLKIINLDLYNKYNFDNFSGKLSSFKTPQNINTIPDIDKAKNFKLLKTLPKISDLPNNHIAKIYLTQRRIPEKYFFNTFYVDEFKKFTNSLIPNKFENLMFDEPRVLFPLTNSKNEIIGYQGRSLNKNIDSRYRYITIMLNNDCPKLYGLDRIDVNKFIYVTEGPIDSMMLDNCIASCGGAIVSEIKKLDIPKEKFVIIYDNERHNEEINKLIKRTIEKEYKIFVWPLSMEYKDLNELYCNSSLSLYQIKKLVDENTYVGLKARMKFYEWEKQ